MQKDPWDKEFQRKDPWDEAPFAPTDPAAYRFVAPGRGERIAGLIYLFLHLFVMGDLISIAFLIAGVEPTLETVNIIYFSVGTVFLLITMRRFLAESFVRFRQFGTRNIRIVLAGYGIQFGLAFLITLAVDLLAPDLTNPNQEVVQELIEQNLFTSLFLAVLLAPLLEELLFRGALFAPLRKKNRFLAYAVSIIGFAFLHIFVALLVAPSLDLLIVLLLYVPAGVALCWVYEKSGSIWTAISLHAFWNLIAVLLGAFVEIPELPDALIRLI